MKVDLTMEQARALAMLASVPLCGTEDDLKEAVGSHYKVQEAARTAVLRLAEAVNDYERKHRKKKQW